MNTILTVDNISKSFDDKLVLEDVNITLRQGEIVSILGVSGVGKTTLFNILSGLIPPDSGTVMLCPDTDITGKTGYLSYMLQKDLLLPHKTVIENAALPLLLNKVPRKKALEIAGEQFEHFGLEGTGHQYPSELSGGMRQRVALLRTYLCGKEVALLDEPFSALDTITRASLQQWYMDMMKDIKLSTLFITHDMDEAILLSDRIYIMKGSPASITDEIIIDEPKPRNSEFAITEGFLEYKKKIRAAL